MVTNEYKLFIVKSFLKEFCGGYKIGDSEIDYNNFLNDKSSTVVSLSGKEIRDFILKYRIKNKHSIYGKLLIKDFNSLFENVYLGRNREDRYRYNLLSLYQYIAKYQRLLRKGEKQIKTGNPVVVLGINRGAYYPSTITYCVSENKF